MAAVKDVYRYLDELAPFNLQMSFDNAGFLVGRGDSRVTGILIALDITEEVIREAAERGAELIVTHHPVIFHPAKEITDAAPAGRKLLALAEHGIAAICAHTNLDVAVGGVNDALAQKLGLTEICSLQADGADESGVPAGLGRVGYVAGDRSAAEFAAFVKAALEAGGVRYVDGGRPVRAVAVCGGAGADLMGDVLARGCDTFVTADVSYHEFLDAKELGLTLVDAGHFPTENVVCPVLAGWLEKRFPDVEIMLSNRHHEAFSYL